MGNKPGQGSSGIRDGALSLGSQYSGAKKQKAGFPSQDQLDCRDSCGRMTLPASFSSVRLRQSPSPCFCYCARPAADVRLGERKNQRHPVVGQSCCSESSFQTSFVSAIKSESTVLQIDSPNPGPLPSSPVRCRLGPPKSQSPKAHDRIRPPPKTSWSFSSTNTDSFFMNPTLGRAAKSPQSPSAASHPNLVLWPIHLSGRDNKKQQEDQLPPSHLMHVLLEALGTVLATPFSSSFSCHSLSLSPFSLDGQSSANLRLSASLPASPFAPIPFVSCIDAT